MDRLDIDRLLRELYALRVGGDLNGLCRLFAADAKFQIAGAGHASPIIVNAAGVKEFRPLLALMIKSFKLGGQTILSILIDGERAAAHWRAMVHSRITGTAVLTEFIDLVDVRDGHISSYVEFFAPQRSQDRIG